MTARESNERGEACTSRLREALELAAKALRMVINNRPENESAPTNMGLAAVEELALTARAACPLPDGEAVEAARVRTACRESSLLWVLDHLATHDRQMREASARYTEQMKRLAERSKTKCEHCGKMTRISRR